MNETSAAVGVVTGATRGIGRAIAQRLCADGMTIVGIGRDENLGQSLENNLSSFHFVRLDVTDSAAVKEAFGEILATHGRIDHLVCNAGITSDQLAMKMSDDQWSRVLDVNLTGTFRCIRAVVRPMLKQRAGSIVALSSIIGETGNVGQANYAASKAGIVALCKSVAKEVATRGVRVNAVAPGFIESEMTAALPEEIRVAYLDRIPLRRAGTAEEIAGVVAFLLSEQASYITGQVIGVNGGMYP